jgi:hypothetical protein
MSHLPEEIVDNILSYCPGYVRADLRRKNISVKLENNIITHIDRKLELHEYWTSEITFIQPKHTDNYAGYISKTIKKSDGFVKYSWIIICS